LRKLTFDHQTAAELQTIRRHDRATSNVGWSVAVVLRSWRADKDALGRLPVV